MKRYLPWLGFAVAFTLATIGFYRRSIPNETTAQWIHAAQLTEYFLHFLLNLVFFLLPGIWAARKIPRLAATEKMAAGILISSLVGYAAFWLYFFHPYVGRAGSFGLFAYDLYILKQLWNRRQNLKSPDMLALLPPFSLTVMVGFFYLAVLHWHLVPYSPTDLSAGRFFTNPLPIDNALPMMFAQHLYDGTDPRAIFGNWLSSDRPPLQTGIVLSLAPVMMQAWGWPNAYLTSAIGLQLLWIPAAWMLLGALVIRPRERTVAILLCALSGFFLVNCTFPWPKFIAATHGLIALGFLVHWSELRRPIFLYLAALAFGLGVLSHGGIVFSLPAVALCFVCGFRKQSKPWASLALAGLIAVATQLPWVAYQKFYNPPGDRLLKYHLAGVEKVDPRSAPLAIVDSYRAESWETFWAYKMSNLRALVGPSTLPTHVDNWRASQFFFLLPTLGFLNFAWIGLAYPKRDRSRSYWMKRLLWGQAASLLFWIAAMFGPYSTILHQGSYVTFAILFLALGIFLQRLPAIARMTIAGLNTFIFGWLWISATPTPSTVWRTGIPNPFMVAVAALTGWYLIKKLVDNLTTSATHPTRST